MRIIGIEEHFNTPELQHYSASAQANLDPRFWRESSTKLKDLAGQRLADMDECGVDMQVLSLTAPGVQAEQDQEIARVDAQRVNDLLAGVVREHPDRFAGFAAVPTINAGYAAEELLRGVTELGLKGALINGHASGQYLDEDGYRPLWETAEQLGVPIYLHPANSFDRWHVLGGHPELAGPAWGWGAEAASHALRLVFGGVFDRHPGATIILGHMGEGLPYWVTRLDSRWKVANKHGRTLRRKPSDYIRDNVVVTTSGVCHLPALRCAIDTVGVDRVLFSADYPMEDLGEAVSFLAEAPMTEDDRAKIAYRNAERLLGL